MAHPAASHSPRINEQLLAYWQFLPKGAGLPAESSVDVDALGEAWNSCFLVRIDEGMPRNYTYVTLGEALVDAYGDDWTNRSVCEALVYPHPEPLLQSFDKVAVTAQPHTEDNEFRNAVGLLIKYRSCLVPLSRDGGNDVTYILGCMKWKAY